MEVTIWPTIKVIWQATSEEGLNFDIIDEETMCLQEDCGWLLDDECLVERKEYEENTWTWELTQTFIKPKGSKTYKNN